MPPPYRLIIEAVLIAWLLLPFGHLLPAFSRWFDRNLIFAALLALMFGMFSGLTAPTTACATSSGTSPWTLSYRPARVCRSWCWSWSCRTACSTATATQSSAMCRGSSTAGRASAAYPRGRLRASVTP